MLDVVDLVVVGIQVDVLLCGCPEMAQAGGCAEDPGLLDQLLHPATAFQNRRARLLNHPNLATSERQPAQHADSRDHDVGHAHVEVVVIASRQRGMSATRRSVHPDP